MKWAMFTKKTHDFSWNEQCSQQKNAWPPWNEQCSPKKHMTSMKWAMFTKKTHDFSWNEQCSQKKHTAFHEIINIYQKTTHDLPWNEPCSQKNTLPFMKCTMSTKKKHIIFHEFAWNNQQNIERSAVLQVRGLMPFPQPLRWADGRWVLLVLIQWIFGGFCEIFVGMI